MSTDYLKSFAYCCSLKVEIVVVVVFLVFDVHSLKNHQVPQDPTYPRDLRKN